jgi:Tfp pilus assembly protein PilO
LTRLKGVPPRAQIALVVTGGVLVVAVGWLVLIGPKQRHISDLRTQESATRAQIADDLARAAEAQGTTTAPTVKTADVYKLNEAMPSTTDLPDLLLELNQTAEAAGVSLDSIDFAPPAPSADGTYSTIQITVQAKGNFYTLTDLLYRLRNLVYVRDGALQASGRIFSVGVLSLTPGQKTLGAQITLDTYLYGSIDGGTTAPAAPATTTPTTTTTTTATTTTTPESPPPGPSAAGATS